MKYIFGFLGIASVIAFFSFSISIGFYQPLILPFGAFLFLLIIAYLKFDKSQKRIKNIIWISTLAYIGLSIVWPKYIALHPPGFPPINVHRIANLLAIVSGILGFFYSSWFKKELVDSFQRARAFWIFFGLLVFFRLASVFASEKFYHSLYVCLSDVFVHMFFVFSGVFIGANRRNFNFFSIIITIGFFINFLIGTAEFSMSKNLFNAFLDSSNPDLEWILSAKTRGESYRANSIFTHPIVFAEFASVGFCFALSTLFYIKRPILRYLSIAIAVFCVAAMVITSGSRSGYVAAGIAISLLLFSSLINSLLRGKLNLKIVTFWSFVLGIAIIAVGVLAVIVYEHALGKGNDEASNQARISMLERTAVKLVDSPILGYGPGMGGEIVGTRINRANSAFTIDCLFISYIIDSGIIAFISFCALIIIGLTRSFTASIKGKEENWFVFYAIGTATIAFVLFKIILSLAENNFLLFTILGITVSRIMVYDEAINEPKRVQNAM